MWQSYWDEAFDESKARSPEFDPTDYYRSGRRSKAYPEKEGPEWWAENGPGFVEKWTSWRESSGLKVAEFPDKDGVAVPGIELEVWAHHEYAIPSDLQVRSIIDRVFVDADDNLYIVDLKTGSHTDPWPLQMALNNLCLRHTFGVSAKWAGFWKARTGGVDKWHDLDRYTDEVMWEWVANAKEIRDRQLFIPNPGNLCTSACGVQGSCLAVGGTVTLFSPQDATSTQGE